MPDVNEGAVYSALLRHRVDAVVQTDVGPIRLRMRPVDNRIGDSPDFFLWVDLDFEVFGKPVRLSVPVPVEAEKGGILGGALDDLHKFVVRQRHPIQLPMVVVAESGHTSKAQRVQLASDVTLVQLPVRNALASVSRQR